MSRPTTDLYFVNAMGHLIRGFVSSGPIQPIGVNSFRVGDVAIVLRQDNAATMHEILSRRWREIVYVIDDDIEAGIQDPSFSLGYRVRLKKQYQRCYKPLIHAADRIVTGSTLLAEKLAKHAETHAIHPCWQQSLAPESELQGTTDDQTFRIVYLGAQSHAADLASKLSAIERVLGLYPKVEFTSFLDLPELRRMAEKLRIVIRPMRTWNHYRRWVGTERFDLALYPLEDTPFNQARSVNKLIEHTVVGAVGMYSKDWVQARHVTDGVDAFLVDADEESWIQSMTGAIERRNELGEIFSHARGLAEKLNDVGAQRAFWSSLLPI